MKIMKFLIGILISVGIVFLGIKIVKQKREQQQKLETAKMYPIKVKTELLKEEEVILTLPYIADVKNENSVIISSKFGGQLYYIKEIGEKIQKGEIIAKIDNTFLKTKLGEINSQINSIKEGLISLKIALNNLIISHKRTQKLLDVKMASQQQYETESTKIAQIKAEIFSNQQKLLSLELNKESIKNDLKYTNIISPIDGVISDKFINKYGNVFGGKPILKISANSGNYLLLNLPYKPKGIIYKKNFYNIIDLKKSLNGLKSYKIEIDDTTLVKGEKVNIQVVNFKGKGRFLSFNSFLTIDGKNFVLIPQKNRAIAKQVTVISSGSKGIVIKENISKVIKANGDILLKIKAGYPIKVMGE